MGGRVQDKVGIGLSAATLMAREGAKVVIADFKEEGAKVAAAQICEQGGETAGIFLDAAKEHSIQEAVAFTVRYFSSLTVLYNNVGLTNLQNPSITDFLDYVNKAAVKQ